MELAHSLDVDDIGYRADLIMMSRVQQYEKNEWTRRSVSFTMKTLEWSILDRSRAK